MCSVWPAEPYHGYMLLLLPANVPKFVSLVAVHSFCLSISRSNLRVSRGTPITGRAAAGIEEETVPCKLPRFLDYQTRYVPSLLFAVTFETIILIDTPLSVTFARKILRRSQIWRIDCSFS